MSVPAFAKQCKFLYIKLVKKRNPYTEQTVARHLSDCVLARMDLNWKKLNVTSEMVQEFDNALTEKIGRRNCANKKASSDVRANLLVSTKEAKINNLMFIFVHQHKFEQIDFRSNDKIFFLNRCISLLLLIKRVFW